MRTDKYVVLVEVNAPHGADKAAVSDIVTRLINEGLLVCEDMSDSNEYTRFANSCKFAVRDARFRGTDGTDVDCSLDFDHSYYYGDGEDGVYFDAFEGEDGRWWLSAVVDCNTGSFTDNLVDQDGPFNTYKEAVRAGLDHADEWCSFNDVAVESVWYDELAKEFCDG